MNFGAARLGFWFVGQGLQYNPFYALNIWDAQQFPLPVPNTFGQFEFNPNGTVSVTTNSTGNVPLADYASVWKLNDNLGSEYEISADITLVNVSGDVSWQIFGETPISGNSTAWYNLGTQRIWQVSCGSGVVFPDTCTIGVDLKIGLAGKSMPIIKAPWRLSIGSI